MTEKKKPKPMTDMEYYHYCQRKGISHPDIDEREVVRNNNHGFYRKESYR